MTPKEELTGSLEDYLETVYELVRDKKIARVKDIARARNVKPGSVSPAMKRLSEQGLVRYDLRDRIDLTAEGLKQARRIYARHQVLTRLFRDVFGLSPDEAQKNACTMEHSLTTKAMDRMVQFIEFAGHCPGGKSIMEAFHSCGLGGREEAAVECKCASGRVEEERAVRSLSDLAPGERAEVAHVRGTGAIRQRLLDMGILPNVSIEVIRVAPAGEPLWIKIQGFQLSLRRAEANEIIVVASA